MESSVLQPPQKFVINPVALDKELHHASNSKTEVTTVIIDPSHAVTQPVPEVFKCFICKMLVYQPEQCEACDTPFCKLCIKKRCQTDKNCPDCNEVYKDRRYNVKLMKQLEAMQFKCPETASVYLYNDSLKHAQSIAPFTTCRLC